MKNNQARPKTKRSKTTKLMASDLRVNELNGKFRLCFDDEILLTTHGDDVEHPSRAFIEHIIAEFDIQGTLEVSERMVVKPRFFGSYALFGIQKAYVEYRKDDLSIDFENKLRPDPILYPCAGPEVVEQGARWQPVFEYIEEKNALRDDESRITLPSLPQLMDFNEDSSETDQKEFVRSCGFTDDFVSTVRHDYDALRHEQRTVTMFLYAIHQAGVLFPMLLAMSKCTPDQFARGVMAGHCILVEVFVDVASKDHRKMFIGLRDDARTALEYVRLYRSGPLGEIQAGEDVSKEFKSTLRWNIKAGRNDDAITHSVLKTIAAFLNSDGGTLFLGVDNTGTPLGLDSDGFRDIDHFGLHLNNVVKDSMGATNAAALQVTYPLIDGKQICRIEIPRSTVPVYLKYKSDEEFFIRTGPSTTKLAPSDLVKYVDSHFTQSRK
jgi:hypothetical protein